jgi:hypothetical protein
MERVETLLKKLQEQFAQNATPGQLLLTVQMLQAELLHLQATAAPVTAHANVSVMIPANDPLPVMEEKAEEEAGEEKEKPVVDVPEEKTIEVLQVDEAEIEAELEEIKRNAEAMQKISIQNKPAIHFEPEEEPDIPTLPQQQQTTKIESPKKAVNENTESGPTSVNEKFRQSKIDLGESYTEVPIRDLKKAIGVNDRFLFINELFRGDEAVYERSIKTINSFSILPEAEYWIQRELKVKNGWNDNDTLVKQFYQLVTRRFSSIKRMIPAEAPAFSITKSPAALPVSFLAASSPKSLLNTASSCKGPSTTIAPPASTKPMASSYFS